MAFLRTMALGAIISVKTDKASRNVGKLGNQVNGLTKSTKRSGAGLQALTIGLGAVTAAGTALIAGLGFMATQAAGFEQQMASVQSVMLDVSGKAMPALKKKAEELALATTFSASEVAQGMELMARAGFKTGEIIEGIGGVLNVAASEGIGLAEASGIVSATLKGMGLQTADATKVADVLAVAATSTKSSIRTLGQAMSNASTTAKTFGLSLEDTVASVALMQDVGIDAAESGTALKTMLLKLASPSDSVAEKMDKLGLKVQDANGDMLPFQQVIGNLSQALPKLGGNIQQAGFLTELFGLRGIKAGISLADAFNKPDGNLSQLVEKLKNAEGAAQKMADIKLDNLTDQIGLVGSSMEVLSIRMFGPFLDLAKDGVKDLVIGMNEVAKGLAGEGTSGAAQFGKGMATALKLVNDGIKDISRFLQPIVKGMENAFGPETASVLGTITVAAVGLAVVLTPVVAVVAAIAAAAFLLGSAFLPVVAAVGVGLVAAVAVAAGMFAVAQSRGESMGQFLTAAFDQMKSGWLVFTAIFGEKSEELKSVFMGAVGLLAAAWSDLTSAMSEGTGDSTEAMVPLVNFLGQAAIFTAGLATGFVAWAAIFVKAGALFVRHIGIPIGRFFGRVFISLVRFATGFLTAFNNAGKSGAAFVKDMVIQLTTFLDVIDQAIVGTVNSIIDAVTKVVGLLLEVARDPVVQFAMKKAGFDPTKAVGALQRTAGVLQGAKLDRLGISDPLKGVQDKLGDSLSREARSRAAATAPDVTAQVTVEDKRTICIQNELKVDGRDMAIATKEAEVELTERAGFSITPWQKRQILERGATVLNPT